jgi:hypothetical protein
MTAMTTPVFVVMGVGVLPGLLVALLLGGVLLVASYALGHAVGGTRLAWLTLALTASAPVVIAYSRSYNFAIAAAATSALLLVALARSQSLDHRGWMVAAGALVGLTALARTMTLSYLPAVMVPVLLALVVGPRRGRRLGNAALAAAAALVVAGPWYRVNGRRVLDYLTSTGYGRGSSAYGHDQSLLATDSWRATVLYTTATNGLPLLLLWLLGAAIGLGVVTRRSRTDGLLSGLARVCRSPLLPSAAWGWWGLVALTTTGTKGTGFLAPLIPALAVLTGWAVMRCPRRARVVLVGVVGAVLCVNTAVSTDASADLARPTRVDLPWLGATTVTDGRGNIQRYVADAHGPDGSGLLAHPRAWTAATDRLAGMLDADEPTTTVFGFRHRLVNSNTVQLAQLLAGRRPLVLGMIDPVTTPNDRPAMVDWLTIGAAGGSCLLLTARGTDLEIAPLVDADLMVQAARRAGFVRTTTTIELPDRRTVVVWRRPATCPVTDAAGPAA